MYLSRNSWGNLEYKGINTRWVTQEGQRFEVQFHTPESFHAKQNITHEAYERIVILDLGWERMELANSSEKCRRGSDSQGPLDVPDYKKEGY